MLVIEVPNIGSHKARHLYPNLEGMPHDVIEDVSGGIWEKPDGVTLQVLEVWDTGCPPARFLYGYA